MSSKKIIHLDSINVINHVWAYNQTQKRFEFDNKTYERDGKWYWLHSDKFVRDVDEREIEFMENYLKTN